MVVTRILLILGLLTTSLLGQQVPTQIDVSKVKGAEKIANKGVPGGYVPLGLDSKVSSTYLPTAGGAIPDLSQNGIPYRSGTGTSRPATYADVMAMWTTGPACNSSNPILLYTGGCGSASGTSSSGASQTSQLQDWLLFTRVSPTSLRFGDSCTLATPCLVDIGGSVTAFGNGPYTITFPSTGALTGSICVYVVPGGPPATLTIGVGGSTLTSSNVTVSSGATVTAITNGSCSAVPNTKKLYSWDFVSGALNNSGTPLAAAYYYEPTLSAGNGIIMGDGSPKVVSVDPAVVARIDPSTGKVYASLLPTSSSSSGINLPPGWITPNCTPNGSTDNTLCIQAAFDALKGPGLTKGFGGTLAFGSGDYIISSTINLSNCTGCKVWGSGWATRFIWKGPPKTSTTNSIMFFLHGVRDNDWRDFRIAAGGSAFTLYSAIASDNPRASQFDSTYTDPGHNRFSGINIEGQNGPWPNGWITNCFWLKGDQSAWNDANNDQNYFEENVCSNFSGSAFAIQHSQSLSNIFQNNQVYYGGAYIAGDPDATYGSRGTFMLLSGFTAQNNIASFMIKDATANVTIANITDEGSVVGIKSDSGSGAILGLNVSNYEFRAGCPGGGFNCTVKFLDWGYPGPVSLSDLKLSGVDHMQLAYHPIPGLGGTFQFTMDRVVITTGTIGGTTMTTPGEIFPQSPPSRVSNSFVNSLNTANNYSLDMGDGSELRKTVSNSFSMGASETDFLLGHIGVVGQNQNTIISLPDMGYFSSRFKPGKLLTVSDDGCQAGNAGRNIIVKPNTGFGGGNNTGQSTLNGTITGWTINVNCGTITIKYIGNNNWIIVGKT